MNPSSRLPLLFLLLFFFFALPGATRGAPPPVLLTSVYFDPFLSGEASEAVQIQNMASSPVPLGGWKLTDGEGMVTFPAGAILAPGKIWVSKSAAAFESEFGFAPAFEYGADSDPAVPQMTGSAPSFANAGDQVILQDDTGQIVDAVVYGAATLPAPDWSGAPIQPYKVGGSSTEGQILYRKMQEANGMPVPDSNSASDWAQDQADPRFGKRVSYPGWDLEQFFQTVRATEPATVKYCVAPDHLYACMRDELLSATSAISLEIYAIDNAFITDALTRTLEAGVHVSLLVDGGALTEQGKWACQQFERRGGECWIIEGKPQSNIHKRFDSLHAKWLVIDRRRVLIGSENMGDDAMPADDPSDGTRGTRGGFVITDNPAMVSAAETILDRDFDPTRHPDVRRWGTSVDDFPPPGFAPSYINGGKGYPIRFPTPLVLNGAFPMELVQCPENCLRQSDSLLGMVGHAGAGDRLYVEQLYEYPYWGASTANAMSDPNLRLEAYVAAARRGAQVRILLDSFFDTFSAPRSNFAACAYVNQFAGQLDIQCRLGNPTGRGIHAKLVLLRHGATAFVHLGSINGSETSNKLNREVALQVESNAAFDYWARVFDADWSTTTLAPHRQSLPRLVRQGQ